MKTIVELKNLVKIYQRGLHKVNALNNVSYNFNEGEFYSVIGPSGSGKSSLLQIIGAIDKPTSGRLWINGTEVSGLSEKGMTKIRAKEIGFVFQNFNLNPILNALENVAMALRVTGESRRVSQKKAEETLVRVGLAHRIKHFPNELSGGECQRVAIARAVIKMPKLILADEPTGSLDSKTGIEITELLRDITLDYKTTVIQVTHNLDLANLSHSIIKLKDGQIIN